MNKDTFATTKSFGNEESKQEILDEINQAIEN